MWYIIIAIRAVENDAGEPATRAELDIHRQCYQTTYLSGARRCINRTACIIKRQAAYRSRRYDDCNVRPAHRSAPLLRSGRALSDTQSRIRRTRNVPRRNGTHFLAEVERIERNESRLNGRQRQKLKLGRVPFGRPAKRFNKDTWIL